MVFSLEFWSLIMHSTIYWKIFASLNFREFRISFPIRENLFCEILGGVAHYELID